MNIRYKFLLYGILMLFLVSSASATLNSYSWARGLEDNATIWISTNLTAGVTKSFIISNTSTYSANPNNVFLFYDDFEDNSINTTIWSTTGSVSESGGRLIVTGYASGNLAYSNSNFNLNGSSDLGYYMITSASVPISYGSMSFGTDNTIMASNVLPNNTESFWSMDGPNNNNLYVDYNRGAGNVNSGWTSVGVAGSTDSIMTMWLRKNLTSHSRGSGWVNMTATGNFYGDMKVKLGYGGNFSFIELVYRNNIEPNISCANNVCNITSSVNLTDYQIPLITTYTSNDVNISENNYVSIIHSYLCYQESANVANQGGNDGRCGLNYSGNYLNTNDSFTNCYWSCSSGSNHVYDMYDGNFGTGCGYSGCLSPGYLGHLYINYSKPINASNSSFWYVVSGSNIISPNTYNNISIPSSCWNYDSSRLDFKVDTSFNTGNILNLSCFNGSEWFSLASLTGAILYEDAMYWNISGFYVGAYNISFLPNNIITSNSTLTYGFSTVDPDYSYAIFNISKYDGIFNASFGSNTCFQEFANISTSCGGLSSGSYSSNISSTNWNDGDYSTFVNGNNLYYVNYTIPSMAFSNSASIPSKWLLKTGSGSINISVGTGANKIDLSCWNTGKLQFLINVSGGVARTSCFNGSKWVSITNIADSSIYEEAMYWQMGLSEYDVNTTNTTSSLSSILSDGKYYYGLNIFESDGTTYFFDPNVTIDTTPPSINFSPNSESNNSVVYRNYLFVNVSVNDSNYNYTLIRLYNSTRDLINSSFSNSSNFTNLADGSYYFNATACDLVGLCNSTSTYIVNISSFINVTAFKSLNASFVQNFTLNVFDSVTNLSSNYSTLNGTVGLNVINGRVYILNILTSNYTAGTISKNISLRFDNVTFYDFGIVACGGVTNTTTLIIKYFDENNPSNPINASNNIQISTFNGLYSYNVSFSLTANTTHSLCLLSNITVNATIYSQYTSNYTNRYYIFNGVYNSSNQTIILYNWIVDTASLLRSVWRYTSTWNPISNVVVQLQRNYVGEGVWRTVQEDLTDNSGNAYFHIIQLNTDYKLVVYDINGSLIFTSDTYKFSCDIYNVCNLNVVIGGAKASVDLGSSVVVTPSYNNVTNILTINYVDSTGANNNVNVLVQTTNSTNTRTICSLNMTGSSGSSFCNMTGYYGVIKVSSFVNGYIVGGSTVDLASQTLGKLIGTRESSFWTFAISCVMVGAGFISPVVAIITITAAYVFVYLLGLFTPLTLLILTIISVISIVIAVKLRE